MLFSSATHLWIINLLVQNRGITSFPHLSSRKLAWMGNVSSALKTGSEGKNKRRPRDGSPNLATWYDDFHWCVDFKEWQLILQMVPQLKIYNVGPILTELPKWIELGAYREFGDDEIPICDVCKNVCEWVYFKLLQFNSDGLYLCSSCLENNKKPTPWSLYVREGLIVFLSTLNAAAGPPPSAKSPVGLEIQSSDSLLVPAAAPLPSKSKSCSPAHSFEQPSASGQLLDTCKFEPVSQSRKLLLTTSSEPLKGVSSSEQGLLKSNSEPLLFAPSSEPLLFTPSSVPMLFRSNDEPLHFTAKSEPLQFTGNSEPAYYASNLDPLHFTSDSGTALFSDVEPAQFTSHSDSTLLTSNSEPVLFTSNAEPVHFLSHSKPVLFSPNAEPVLFTSYPESGSFSESLGLLPKSESLGFASTSGSISFISNLESLPKTVQVLNHDSVLFSSNSGTLPTTPNSELSQSNAEVSLRKTENSVRTQSKNSGKKVSDGTLVDRMRTIVQQDCRLGKDLFTTGIELAERYNSCFEHETIHVRRVFEAMKTLGYAASKDTMQVQVQKVRRKVKLIYGLAMK